MTKNNKAEGNTSEFLEKSLANIDPVKREYVDAKMLIAVRIDDLRVAKGWTKSQFAERLGKQPSEVSKWLSGTHNFTIEVLVTIAFAFGVHVSELLVDLGYQITPIQTSQKVQPKRDTGGRIDAETLLAIAKHILSLKTTMQNLTPKEELGTNVDQQSDTKPLVATAGNTQYALAA